MTRRVITSTLVCAAIVFACAPRVGLGGGDAAHSPDNAQTPTASDSLHGLNAELNVHTGDGDPRFELVVTNHSDRTEIRWPSGLTHEFIVLDARDREVWRSSNDRLYTQTLQTRQLRTGATLRYSAKWREAPPGQYRVIAVLTSDTHPQRTESWMRIQR